VGCGRRITRCAEGEKLLIMQSVDRGVAEKISVTSVNPVPCTDELCVREAFSLSTTFLEHIGP